MAELFQRIAPTDITGDRRGLADYLEPGTAGPHVNVLYNYSWTLSKPENRTEVPIAVLTEYRVLQSQLQNAAKYYITGASNYAGLNINLPGTNLDSAPPITDSGNPYSRFMDGYRGLFDFSRPTKFYYTLPYFSDVSGEVTNTYTTLDILEKAKNAISFVSPGVGESVDTLAKLASLGLEANYPRVGIMDRPKLWESSTPRSINIKFPLFNTQNEEDIIKNWELCYLLTYQNMFNKRDFITAIPPVFYTVYIPGQYFSFAAYVSDIKIYNRGHLHYMQIGGKFRNVPDVYEIDITLTDMVMPSQNMHSVLMTEQPINSSIFNG